MNRELLTVGFDHPGVDCVAVLRPTMSPGLWAQMVGRGLRRCEGKTDCLVLDPFEVVGVSYCVHVKRNAAPGHPQSMAVRYQTSGGAFTEYILLEHANWPRWQACKWWQQRSEKSVPHSTDHAVRIAKEGGLREPVAIVVQHDPGKPFPEIVDCVWGDVGSRTRETLPQCDPRAQNPTQRILRLAGGLLEASHPNELAPVGGIVEDATRGCSRD